LCKISKWWDDGAWKQGSECAESEQKVPQDYATKNYKWTVWNRGDQGQKVFKKLVQFEV